MLHFRSLITFDGFGQILKLQGRGVYYFMGIIWLIVSISLEERTISWLTFLIITGSKSFIDFKLFKRCTEIGN